MIMPIEWLVAWLVAISFHEICHCFAVKLCGGKSYHLSVGFGGAIINCSELTGKCQLICLLAGPFGGLLLALLGRWFPRVALCTWVLSVYNLLPLLPLDGGQALQLLIKNKKIFYAIEKVVLVVLTLGGIYLSLYWHFGALPVVIVGILWLKNRKSPCKA